MSTQSANETGGPERKTGMVKWFNSQAGYGFIAMKSESGEKEDLFVHHSDLHTTQDMFSFLVEGEYVEYSVKTIKRKGEEKVTAHRVTGIDGGPLQCETRYQRRAAETERIGPSGGGRNSDRSPSPDSKLWSVVREQF